MQHRPQARTEGLVAERVDDELVIYDQLSQTAHSLSAAAALVWEYCDGQRSSLEIAEELSLETTMVEQALSELRSCGLLDEGAVPVTGYSRREAALKFARVGGAAFAAPLIYSVVIPSAAAAASCVHIGGIETTLCSAVAGQKTADAKCCTGECYNNAGTKTCVAANCFIAGQGGDGSSGSCVATTCCSGTCDAPRKRCA